MSATAQQLFERDADLAASIALIVAAGSVGPAHTRAFLTDRSNVLVAGFFVGEPVGFISAHILDRFKDLRRKMFIYEVDVLPAFHRRGVGRAMLEKVLEIARRENADTAFVLTNRSNSPAVGLYSDLGGRETNPDDLMMEFHL
jgi:ribosomal protein S18 acetylase RimI-like enzyme